jgi:hypothetical protein
MAETNKKEYIVIDNYGESICGGSFNDYEDALEQARTAASENQGFEFFVAECKRITKVYIPDYPEPIVENL